MALQNTLHHPRPTPSPPISNANGIANRGLSLDVDGNARVDQQTDDRRARRRCSGEKKNLPYVLFETRRKAAPWPRHLKGQEKRARFFPCKCARASGFPHTRLETERGSWSLGVGARGRTGSAQSASRMALAPRRSVASSPTTSRLSLAFENKSERE